MPSLFDPQVRTAILDRVSRLRPERKPVWGRFTAPEMVCHVSSDLRQGLGELDAGPPSSLLARFPMNWLAIHVVPWPKGKGQESTGVSRHAPDDVGGGRRAVAGFD